MPTQNQTQEATSVNQEPVAYYYEFITEANSSSGQSTAGSPANNSTWLTVLRKEHPDQKTGIVYQNLQRLLPLDEVEGTPDPVGFIFDIIPERGPKKVEVTRSRISEELAYTGTELTNIRPLAPIKQDRDTAPRPEPYKKEGRAMYFEETKTLKQVYYRVDKVSGETTTMERPSEGDDWDFIENTRPEKVLEMLVANNAEPVPYDQTPFSLPKYQYSASEYTQTNTPKRPNIPSDG